MTRIDASFKPQLRPVEAIHVEMDGGIGFALRDPTGLSPMGITVSQAALYILSQFDGARTMAEIQESFQEQFGQAVEMETLLEVVNGLREAHLLAGPEFEDYYESLVRAYRSAPTRVMRSAADLRLDHDPAAVLQDLLDAAPEENAPNGAIVGLIVPHLDYPRGRPCYSAAYSLLANRPAPNRVVILGTNHFGRSASPVATAKDFETPLGTTRTDTKFIDDLERRCGHLRTYELDHDREHSVELQLLICQHIWGAEAFQIVPILCSDPCGPTGTAPYDGQGVDLADFAAALRDAVRDDDGDTLVIAGADLSHFGAHFGDERDIEASFTGEIEARDRLALEHVAGNQPDAFVRQVALDGNPTRVCSAGCIYTAMSTLPHAKVKVLRYHQAVDEAAGVGVSCAAAVFTA